MNTPVQSKHNGTPRPVKVAAMLFVPILIAGIVACDNGSGNGSANPPAAAPTAASQAPASGGAYAGLPEGKPPVMGAPVPDPAEQLNTEPSGQMPAFLSQAGAQQAKISALYQGAVTNYDAYSHVPCYCGCAIYTTPHKSLAECYIKQMNADGSVVFTDHSMSCDICQGVAQMTVDGLAAKTPLKDIRAAVYNKFKYTQIWTDTPPPTQ